MRRNDVGTNKRRLMAAIWLVGLPAIRVSGQTFQPAESNAVSIAPVEIVKALGVALVASIVSLVALLIALRSRRGGTALPLEEPAPLVLYGRDWW
jgi:uncharacterized membrane protein